MNLQEGKRYLLVKQWEFGSAITTEVGKLVKMECHVGKLVTLSPMELQFDLGYSGSSHFKFTDDKDIIRGMGSSWVILDVVDFKHA